MLGSSRVGDVIEREKDVWTAGMGDGDPGGVEGDKTPTLTVVDTLWTELSLLNFEEIPKNIKLFDQISSNMFRVPPPVIQGLRQ